MLKKILFSFSLIASFAIAEIELSNINWLLSEHIPIFSMHRPLLQPMSFEKLTEPELTNKHYSIIVIEGVKGAGKTSTLKKLHEIFNTAGYFVKQRAIFTDVNKIFKYQGGSYGKFIKSVDDALDAEISLRERFSTAIESFKSEFQRTPNTKGILIFDRGWLTALVSLDDAHSDLSTQQRQDLWNGYWKKHIYPTVFIEVNPEITLERRKGELDVVSGLFEPGLVYRDYHRRIILKQRFSEYFFHSFNTSDYINNEIISDNSYKIAGCVDPNISQNLLSCDSSLAVVESPINYHQHFLSNLASIRDIFSQSIINDKSILEIGVGSGILTKLILEANPKAILGFEIDKTITCEIEDLRFEIFYEDFTTVNNITTLTIGGSQIKIEDENFGIISAPPYDLLPFIKNFIDKNLIRNVILITSSKYLILFPEREGYSTQIVLEGDDFTPRAEGNHYVIKKGFR